jgi:hypothetical protein
VNRFSGPPPQATAVAKAQRPPQRPQCPGSPVPRFSGEPVIRSFA